MVDGQAERHRLAPGNAALGRGRLVGDPPDAQDRDLGRITDQPAPAEGGGITWRKSMTLSLTVDHRGVDGAPAARFLAAVARRLEDPAALL